MGHTETRADAPGAKPLTPAPAQHSEVEIFRSSRISLIARPQFIEPAHLPVIEGGVDPLNRAFDAQVPRWQHAGGQDALCQASNVV